jgi:hypothetical protein
MTPEIQRLLEQRTRVAEGMLREAVRLEVTCFMNRHVEDRLRARPHFVARTPRIALIQMRLQLERETENVTSEAMKGIAGLRAEVVGDVLDGDRLGKTVRGVLEGATTDVLLHWFFPGDSFPDDPTNTAVDLDAQFDLGYEPSPALLWAWRRVRSLDAARRHVTAAGDTPLQPTFEVRVLIAEALPDSGRYR